MLTAICGEAGGGEAVGELLPATKKFPPHGSEAAYNMVNHPPNF